MNSNAEAGLPDGETLEIDTDSGAVRIDGKLMRYRIGWLGRRVCELAEALAWSATAIQLRVVSRAARQRRPALSRNEN